ncbi:MAG: hypothetical protein RL385_6023 [Pseudomonadota bacterium]
MVRQLASVALVLSACTESDVKTTEVQLLITSDLTVPAELDAITVWARGPDGTARDATAYLNDPSDLPTGLHLIRGQAPYAPLEVSITGMRAGRPVVVGCTSPALDPHALPSDERALAPYLADGGQLAKSDAGYWPAKPGGADAGPRGDAGLSSDAGTPPGDAGLDAGTPINIEPGSFDAGSPDGGASQCLLSPSCAGFCETVPLLGGKSNACLCVLQCGFIGVK